MCPFPREFPPKAIAFECWNEQRWKGSKKTKFSEKVMTQEPFLFKQSVF